MTRHADAMSAASGCAYSGGLTAFRKVICCESESDRGLLLYVPSYLQLQMLLASLYSKQIHVLSLPSNADPKDAFSKNWRNVTIEKSLVLRAAACAKLLLARLCQSAHPLGGTHDLSGPALESFEWLVLGCPRLGACCRAQSSTQYGHVQFLRTLETFIPIRYL
jgi:hypothetical protein